LVAEAESRVAAREAQAEQRAREIVQGADAQRARVLDELAAERTHKEAQLQALIGQRDEMLAGLTQLRESLQRSIGQLPGVATPAVPEPVPQGNNTNR
jgi:septal ring factor EnvC (AmiA/AmiB activator)